MGSLSGTGTVLNSANGITSILTVGNGDASSTFAGVIKNNGGIMGLAKVGAGSLILTGSSNYSGGTAVNGGTLQGNTMGLQGTISNNTALVFDQTFNGSFIGTLSGGGSLTKQNSGTVSATPGNGFTGAVFANGGR